MGIRRSLSSLWLLILGVGLLVSASSLKAAVSNAPASGSLEAPRGTVTGFFHPTVAASDPDGLHKVSLVFTAGGEPFELCSDEDAANLCSGTFDVWTYSNIDPADHGVSSSGNLTVGLWVEDDLGWRSLVAQETVSYLKPGVGDSSGQLREPSGTYAGDVIVRAMASDPDGVARVEMDFGLGTSALVLCEPCSGSDWAATQVDPGAFGAAGGTLEPTLYVRDLGGATQAVASQIFQWQPVSGNAPSGHIGSPNDFVDGEVLVNAAAEDPDGLDRVLIRMAGGSAELCGSSGPCFGTADSWRTAGIDPGDLGALSGTVTASLEVRDDNNQTSTVLGHDFQWRRASDRASSGTIDTVTDRGDGTVDVALAVSDPDALDRVSLVFVAGGTAHVVCKDGTPDPCPSGTSSTAFSELGLDPRAYGAGAGTVTVGAWVEDQTGRKELVDDHTFTYSPPAAEGVLSVSPAGGKSISGEEGGPFSSPGSYTVENTGSADLNYAVDASFGSVGSWLNVGGSSGSLTPGETKTVSLSINSAVADGLLDGPYIATLEFENLSTGLGTTPRTVLLTVDPAAQPPPRIGGRITDSGGQPIEGVRINGMPTIHWTDSNGEYGRVVGEGWSGTVRPSKAGYDFVPPSRTYSNVTVSEDNEDFVGSLDSLGILGMVTAGGAGLEGVTLDGLPGPPVTAADGTYEATVSFGFTGTVTPIKAGYVFTPISLAYDDLRGWRTDQNFDGALGTVTLSGQVTRSGSGFSNVWLDGLPGGITTDSSGFYSAEVPIGWNGMVAPKRTGYVFTPPSRTYSNYQGGGTGDYTAADAPAGSFRLWPVSNDSEMRDATVWNRTGDLILVEPGNYTDMDAGGIDPGVTLLSTGGAAVTILTRSWEHRFNQDDVTVDGFTFESTQDIEPVQVYGDRVKIRNSRFRPQPGEFSLRSATASDLLIEGCVFDSSSGLLLRSGSATGEMVVRNNHFTSLSTGFSGGYNSGLRIRIENNVFEDITRDAIDLDDFLSVAAHNNIFADIGGEGIELGDLTQQSSVAHSVFYQNDQAIGVCDASVQVYDNIFQENTKSIDGCSGGTVNVHHDLIWDGTWLWAGPNYIVDSSTIWRDVKNPHFVDAANHDFHLGGSSEAVDIASDGTDLGAYGGSLGSAWEATPGTPEAPPALLDLRIEGRTELSPGETVSLTATGDFANGFYAKLASHAVWSSSNEAVVESLGNGSLRALTPGTATLTATWKEESEMVTVTVLGATPVLSVVATPDPVLPGGTLRYSLSWRNDGPAVVRGARLVASYDSRTSNPVASIPSDMGTDDTWSLGDLEVGGAGSMTLDVDVAGDLVEGDVLDLSVVFETDYLGSVFVQASATIEGRGDLRITKSCSPEIVNPGDEITCVLDWSNHGSGTATGAQVVESYPSGMTFVQAVPAPSLGTSTWELGEVARGATGSIEVDLLITDEAVGDVVNQVDILFDAEDLQPADNRATDTVQVIPRADLAITLVGSPDPVPVGEALFWTSTVSNNGPSTATGIEVELLLPVGTQFSSAPTGEGWTCSSSGDVLVTCMRSTLEAGSSSEIQVPVVAPDQAGSLGSSVTVGAITAELNGVDNAAQATVTVANLQPSTVLVVDDDDGTPDVRAAYTDALEILGVGYDVWDTGGGDNEPDGMSLSSYEAVIWFTGDHTGGTAGPGPAAETALGSYLDGGGCLLISSQDYLFDRGGATHDVPTAFMTSHLGLDGGESDVSQTEVTGSATAFMGRGPYTLALPYGNFSDRLSPTAAATVAFSGDRGDAGVLLEAEVFGAVYLGFGLEGVATAGDRAAILGDMLGFCAQIGVLFGDGFETGDSSRWASGAR